MVKLSDKTLGFHQYHKLANVNASPRSDLGLKTDSCYCEPSALIIEPSHLFHQINENKVTNQVYY